MSDYPVIQVEGVAESTDFAVTGGLPAGIRTVTFTSTKNPFVKKGIYKLVQLCVLLLLRTPGRDILNPESGGGLKQIAAKPVSESLFPVRRGEIGVAVASTECQLFEGQAAIDLPPEERLRSFLLLNADFNFGQQEWLIVARVISEAGGAADVLL